MRKKTFETYLREQNLSENTIRSYVFSVNTYLKMFGKITPRQIAEYKDFLVKNNKPQTVNLRLIGLTKYLKFLKKDKMRPKLVKENRENFLQNVISSSEYEILKTSLKRDGQTKWLFVVRYLGSTGMRISELVQIQVCHIRQGFADICSKGGKTRRIYIPADLQKDTLNWLMQIKIGEGFLFRSKNGTSIRPRSIAAQLKKFARIYNIEEKVLHPHSFRHFFAKNFLENHGDITFLADLLGHESINTTRIYLRKSTEEQRKIINDVVKW